MKYGEGDFGEGNDVDLSRSHTCPFYIIPSFPSPSKTSSFLISRSPSLQLASYKLHLTSCSGDKKIPPLSSSPSPSSNQTPPLSPPSFSQLRSSFMCGLTVWDSSLKIARAIRILFNMTWRAREYLFRGYLWVTLGCKWQRGIRQSDWNFRIARGRYMFERAWRAWSIRIRAWRISKSYLWQLVFNQFIGKQLTHCDFAWEKTFMLMHIVWFVIGNTFVEDLRKKNQMLSQIQCLVFRMSGKEKPSRENFGVSCDLEGSKEGVEPCLKLRWNRMESMAFYLQSQIHWCEIQSQIWYYLI